MSSSIPPTIQTETDIDYNIWGDQFEFITYNYKGDVQYYNTESLRQLTSGILPVIAYPSLSQFDTQNSWTNCSICLSGNGTLPTDINPNQPYNDGKTPSGWISLSDPINIRLKEFNYNSHGEGCLLPHSLYIQESVSHHIGKTVSLFCGLYHQKEPSDYIVKIPVHNNITFYLLNIQNGD